MSSIAGSSDSFINFKPKAALDIYIKLPLACRNVQDLCHHLEQMESD